MSPKIRLAAERTAVRARPKKSPGPPPATSAKRKRRAADRWTPNLIKGGYTPISNFFLERSHELKPEITHGEAMFIIHLMSFKWDKEMPYPAYKTLAKRMFIKHAQARKIARNLEQKGYLRRHLRRSQPNLFDLAPLFAALEKLRDEKLAERKAADVKKRRRPL